MIGLSAGQGRNIWRGGNFISAAAAHAAHAICGHQPDKRALEASASYRACVRTTLDQAVAAANIPQITALHTPARPSQLASARPKD